MNVVCIALNSGQELICELIEEKSSTKIVKEPVSLMMVPSQDGQNYGIQMIPYLPYAESRTFEISDSNIFSVFEPSTEMRNRYSQMFGSGISIAGAEQLNLLKG